MRGDDAYVATAPYRFQEGIVTPPRKRYGACAAWWPAMPLISSTSRDVAAADVARIAISDGQAARLPRFLSGKLAGGRALCKTPSGLTVTGNPRFSSD